VTLLPENADFSEKIAGNADFSEEIAELG